MKDFPTMELKAKKHQCSYFELTKYGKRYATPFVRKVKGIIKKNAIKSSRVSQKIVQSIQHSEHFASNSIQLTTHTAREESPGKFIIIKVLHTR